MFSVLAAGLVLGLGTGIASAQDKATKSNFERKASKVNQDARKPGMMKVALHTISVETGVPQERIEAMHKDNPEAGPAGILIASVMADETKLPPERFLKSHLDGHDWDLIARKNNVPLEKVNERLDHLQRSLNTPEKVKAKRR